MRYSVEHKELTRKKILDAAANRFRAQGYDGLGIDALARAAGVTNGAFYGHFTSKAEAFRQVADDGLRELADGVREFQAKGGAAWLGDFARYYLSDHKLDCAEALCAVPAFGPEAVRAPDATRAAFATGLTQVVEAMAHGLPQLPEAERAVRAWAMLATLAGGVTVLRLVPEGTARAPMVDALVRSVLGLAQP